MRKKIIIIFIILFIFIILLFLIKQIKKTENNEVNEYEGLNYEYNEDEQQYTIYDENGNVRGYVDDESKLKLYFDNPNFGFDDLPLNLDNEVYEINE